VPYELWRLDATGLNGRAIPIAIAGGPKVERLEVPLHATRDGSAYLIGQTDDQPYLVKVAAGGQVAFIRPIDLPGLHPLGIEPDPDGTWTVFGECSDACVARIGEDGRKIWVRTFPKEKLATIFLGAVALKDGSTILAGNIWDFHQGKIGMGLGSTMLVKLDPKGATVAEEVFPGRNAVLTRTEDGEIVLVDDPQSYAEKAGQPAPEDGWKKMAQSSQRMEVWSEDLKRARSASMAGLAAALLPPTVLPAPGSGVIVFSNMWATPAVLARYDTAGRQAWLLHPETGFGSLGGNAGRFALVWSGPDGATLAQFEERGTR